MSISSSAVSVLKMISNKEDYFGVLIKSYNLSGLRYSSKRLWNYISRFVLFPISLIFHLMTIYNLRYKNDIFEITEVFDAISLSGQVMIRKLILILHSRTVDAIIQDRSHFWKYDEAGKDMGNELRKKSQFIFTFLKIFWIICIFVAFLIFITPIFVKDRVLPFECWVPTNNSAVMSFIYFLEIVHICDALILSGICDGGFLVLCTDLEIQFQLLSKILAAVKIGIDSSEQHEENCFLKLKKCAIHYKFLLRMHEKINTVFSEFFAFEFLLNVLSTSIQFYILSDSSSSSTLMIRSLLMIIVIITQNTLIYIPASNIEVEAENLVNEIYNIDWYNTNNSKISTFIIFWLMNAQKIPRMTGIGLLYVTRDTYLRIPRLAFSISTLFSS